MRDALIQYVNLLFAGAPDCEDTRQEILQNTLDRYDDLIAAGKTPEEAYRLAISGIGDVSEILGQVAAGNAAPEAPVSQVETDNSTRKLLRAIAVGLYILCPLPLIVLDSLGMDVIGLCGTLCFVAVATVLIILGGKKGEGRAKEADEPKTKLGKSISGLIWAVGLAIYFLISFLTGAWYVTWVLFPILGAVNSIVCALLPQENPIPGQQSRKLKKGICAMIWTIGTAVYFLMSFGTGAWYITWVIFPIIGAVQGLAKAIWDLKEAVNHET